VVKRVSKIADDPLWYKDAIIYQVHVKSYYDSNGDGIGDFQGLTQKLDHLENLGVTAVWLLPFYPSPLRDDGYDIADYMNIHPQYGTLKDFKEFLRQAHKRGIQVITELVINHTSDQHVWFQKSRRASKGSVWRDYYVWNDTADKYRDARIIFQDFETANWTWDPVTRAYFWHSFYSHQPDLNFDNPKVQKEIFRVADFWFGMGVDGMRLDAVPYLFEEEGTNCENLPQTYEFLKKLRGHVDKKFKNKMLLAEANQWPEDAARYFGEGDACHMVFHFPLMPRMFMALQMEDKFPINDIMEQTPEIPENDQWAIFLRNHDELTLEMVTDEERDYMYRVYAADPRAKINLGIRRRLFPLLASNRKKFELLHILLFSLPGTPIIYYGDEIGMGDNFYLGDRNGVRTPMQWSPDRNAGFSKANPQRLYLPVIIDPEYHFESVNVENQEVNLSSLLWWMRRVISSRKKYKAFSRGNLKFIWVENSKILAFVREYECETILCVANLSRFSQVAELHLEEYADYVTEEIFSQNRFPRIHKHPYVLTLGPHDHFTLILKKEEGLKAAGVDQNIPEIALKRSWKEIFDEKTRDRLQEKILPRYLRGCRWFSRKTSVIRAVRISGRIPLIPDRAELLILKVDYTESSQDQFALPVAFLSKSEAHQIIHDFPQAVIADLNLSGHGGILIDGMYYQDVRMKIFQLIKNRKKIKAGHGELLFYPGQQLRRFLKEDGKDPVASQILKVEQSNTAVVYENHFFLKLYRRLEEGENPDLEVTRFLTEKTKFRNISSFAGGIELNNGGDSPINLGMLSRYISNQGDAWHFTTDHLGQFYEKLLSKKEQMGDIPDDVPSSLLAVDDVPEYFRELTGGFYIEMVQLLGARTREMHEALASRSDIKDFAPENFSALYQRSVYQSMRGQARRVFQVMERSLRKVPVRFRKSVSAVLEQEKDIMRCFQAILRKKFSVSKIRVHGDYHLGQVLFTGKDFVIIDFEGEPIRSVTERKLKRSAFRDVAGMVRSFHYAACSALHLNNAVRSKDIHFLQRWAEIWYTYIGGTFLRSYLSAGSPGAVFVPHQEDEIETLLKIYLLDKAVYELGYELNNRPDRLMIPILGIEQIVKN